MSLFNYLDRVVYQLDCLINAVTGGLEDQPVSLRAALAQQSEKRAGHFGPGCVLCRWLSISVEKNHCAKQLKGEATVRWAAVAAGFQLIVLAFLIFYLPVLWALI